MTRFCVLVAVLGVISFSSAYAQEQLNRARKPLDLTTVDAQEDCPSFDLRDEALGSIQNQGQVGWCYGVAASDILSNLFQKRISPAATAVSYVSRLSGVGRAVRSLFSETSVDGGFVASAVKDAAADGVCLDENAEHGNAYEVYTGNFMTSVAKAAQKGKVPEAMICRHREQAVEIVTDKTHIFYSKGGFKKMVRTMNAAFAEGRIVGIEYNAYFLTDTKFTRIRNHVSTVVGQRKGANNQCQYLLRNTWGLGCIEGSRFVCFDGYYWVPRAEMDRTLIATTVAHFAK